MKIRRVLTVVLTTGALLAVPGVAHAGERDWYAKDQGAVMWKSHSVARPTVAGIPGDGECWRLVLSSGAGRSSVCVDESTWRRTPVGSWYQP
jgi:hypothetical protein